ncbi:hypothetical protein ACFFX0_25335 [Citricoccus parietis]|uniref:Uncharacterized protein n=1 Tax=Citricoccus parietis TaxID=592307 RepID=A0ABV5G5V8_9MICC
MRIDVDLVFEDQPRQVLIQFPRWLLVLDHGDPSGRYGHGVTGAVLRSSSR